MFSSVFRGSGAHEVAKAIYKQLCFPTWACAAGFNNYNNYVFCLSMSALKSRDILKSNNSMKFTCYLKLDLDVCIGGATQQGIFERT